MQFSLEDKTVSEIVVSGVGIGKTEEMQEIPFINGHVGETQQRFSTTVFTHLWKGSCGQLPD